MPSTSAQEVCARVFGLRRKLSRDWRAAHIELGVDLAVVNGELSWISTMPACYVLSPDEPLGS